MAGLREGRVKIFNVREGSKKGPFSRLLGAVVCQGLLSFLIALKGVKKGSTMVLKEYKKSIENPTGLLGGARAF